MRDEERVRVVAEVYETIANQDLERALELTEPDWSFEVDTPRVTREAAYRGHDGLRRFHEEVTSMNAFVTRPRDIVVHEGKVAVLSVTSASGAPEGDVSMLGVTLWDISDEGLVRSVRGFTEPDTISRLIAEIPFRPR